jgi:hypothetical protein
MGVIDRKDLHLHSNIKSYYENLKIDQWQGNPRDRDAGVINTGTGTYYGMAGSRRHLLKTLPLTGLYLLGQFRTTEPRLLTAARTAFAPIVNTTTVGKVVKTGLQVLRGAQQLGLVKVGLTNSYADIPITANPLLRAKSIFKSTPGLVNEIRNKYGLHYNDFNSFGKNRETTYEEGNPYNHFTDLIPVKIGDADNQANTVQMRGMISGVSDTIAPTWNEQTYVGRPDAMVTYGGYKRDFTFVLRVAATSEQDIKPMYEKLNALAKYVLPSVDKLSTRFTGNLCKVTVGSYLRKELCAMTGFVITPLEDSMWETHDPDYDYPSLTLTEGPLKQAMNAIKRGVYKAKLKPVPGTVKSRRQAIKDPFIVPRVLDVSIGLKVLGNKIKTYSEGYADHVSPLFDTKTKSDQYNINLAQRAILKERITN